MYYDPTIIGTLLSYGMVNGGGGVFALGPLILSWLTVTGATTICIAAPVVIGVGTAIRWKAQNSLEKSVVELYTSRDSEKNPLHTREALYEQLNQKDSYNFFYNEGFANKVLAHLGDEHHRLNSTLVTLKRAGNLPSEISEHILSFASSSGFKVSTWTNALLSKSAQLEISTISYLKT